MQIYEFTTSGLTTASGEVSSVTLPIHGGLCRQVLIRSNTSTTLFRANLTDDNSVTFINYGYHRGEINDVEHAIPVHNAVTVNITNASPDDTFRISLKVQE